MQGLGCRGDLDFQFLNSDSLRVFLVQRQRHLPAVTVGLLNSFSHSTIRHTPRLRESTSLQLGHHLPRNIVITLDAGAEPTATLCFQAAPLPLAPPSIVLHCQQLPL